MKNHYVLLFRSTNLGWSDVRATLHAMREVDLFAETIAPVEAIELTERHKPDVIIASARVNDVSTIDVLTDVRLSRSPASRLVVIAARFDPDEFLSFARLGVEGYLLSSDLDLSSLPHLFYGPITGCATVYSPITMSIWRDGLRRYTRQSDELPHLSKRERNVLRRLGQGESRDEIAHFEKLSSSTVNRNVQSLKAKLEVETTTALLVQATLLGFPP